MKINTSIGTIEADKNVLLEIFSAFSDKATYLDLNGFDISAKYYRKVAKEIINQAEPAK